MVPHLYHENQAAGTVPAFDYCGAQGLEGLMGKDAVNITGDAGCGLIYIDFREHLQEHPILFPPNHMVFCTCSLYPSPRRIACAQLGVFETSILPSLF